MLFGPVPARVSAETKLELLGLIDGAVKGGWAHTRACQVLDGTIGFEAPRQVVEQPIGRGRHGVLYQQSPDP